MRALTLALALTTVLCGGCVLGGNSTPDAGPPVDAGPTGPVNVPLNEVTAAFTITYNTAVPATATITATFATATGTPVVLMGLQAVSVGPTGGTLTPLALSGTNTYAATVPSATSFDIKVDEPTKGVVTSTVQAPEQPVISSPAANGPASLSGFTVTWTPIDSTSKATVTLSETGATPPQITEMLGSDTGTYTFTLDELNPFFQGTPLTLSVQVNKTIENGVQLFASSTVSVQIVTSEQVTPGS